MGAFCLRHPGAAAMPALSMTVSSSLLLLQPSQCDSHLASGAGRRHPSFPTQTQHLS